MIHDNDRWVRNWTNLRFFISNFCIFWLSEKSDLDLIFRSKSDSPTMITEVEKVVDNNGGGAIFGPEVGQNVPK